MGRINWGRVLGGGLLAGVVLNVVDYVVNGVILKADWDAAMAAINRKMDDSMIIWFVVADFLVGIFLVWLYAAIRPRFGAGPKTAVIAGLAYFWVMGVVNGIINAAVGVFPMRLFVIGCVQLLVCAPVAAVVGAWPYREEGDAVAGAAGRRMAGAA